MPPIHRQDLDLMAASCQWSPFNPELIAVAHNHNFGVVGSGAVSIFSVPLATSTTSTTTSAAALAPTITSSTQISTKLDKETIFDLAWSQRDNATLAYTTATSLILWNVLEDRIIAQYDTHTEEVSSVDWNGLATQYVLSGSWDNNIHLYDVQQLDSGSTTTATSNLTQPLSTFNPGYSVNEIEWNPQYGDMFASCGTSTKVSLWDTNAPPKPIANIDFVAGMKKAHQNNPTSQSPIDPGSNIYEANSIAFDKYNSNLLYCALNEPFIMVYDIRNIKEPISMLSGHEFPVKKLIASPHKSGMFLSSSYDISIGVWDLSRPVDATKSNSNNNTQINTQYLVGRYEDHSELAPAMDFHPSFPNLVASAGYDKVIDFWDVGKVVAE